MKTVRKYGNNTLVQKHTGKESCEGCYFEEIRYLPNHPCCERSGDDKFLFPCNKDVIYVKL
jgi:hypothetical protein